jgi:hypothetical protein
MQLRLDLTVAVAAADIMVVAEATLIQVAEVVHHILMEIHILPF